MSLSFKHHVNGPGRPADDFEVEFHLTPQGWKRGSEWFFGRLEAECSPPPDRLLTLRKHLVQPFSSAPKTISWATVWRDTRFTDDELDLVRSRHPLPEAQ